jgi:hypothetical protein
LLSARWHAGRSGECVEGGNDLLVVAPLNGVSQELDAFDEDLPVVGRVGEQVDRSLRGVVGRRRCERYKSPAGGHGYQRGAGLKILEGLDTLFTRLHAAGEITASDPAWCSHLYLAILMEIADLPADSPALGLKNDDPADELGARTDLMIRTLLGALGGAPPR